MTALLSDASRLTTPGPAKGPRVGPRAALALPDLIDLVTNLAADPASWRPQVRHRPDDRWWTRLVSDGRVDVWLITWPGGEATELHDHGGSSAAFTVVEGTLEEVRSSRSGRLHRATFEVGAVRSVAPGIVHDVRNPTGTPAASIHAYSPPLAAMTYYRHHPDRNRGSALQAVRTVRSNQPEAALTW